MDWLQNGVKIVRANELDPNTPQTPGMAPEPASAGKAEQPFHPERGK